MIRIKQKLIPVNAGDDDPIRPDTDFCGDPGNSAGKGSYPGFTGSG